MKKYIVKRIRVGNVGWEYNPNRNMWEMWHRGETHWCVAVYTSTVIHDFIEYNFRGAPQK